MNRVNLISFVLSAFVLTCLVPTEGLICWTCNNERSNRECRRNGRMQICHANEEACQNEVRRGSDGLRVTKRCKQAHACDNNFVQNPRASWAPSQCNSRTPSSVCRCCCAEDLCNRRSLDCLEPTGCNLIRAPAFGTIACDGPVRQPGVTCSFSCNRGFLLLGDDSSTCRFNDQGRRPRYDRPPPICEPESCQPRQTSPTNGDVSCNNDNILGSVCTFTCNEGFALIGNSETTCRQTDSGPVWDNDPPICDSIQCFPAQIDPVNGNVDCSNGNNLGSDCTFTCSFGFFLDGAIVSTCLDDFDHDAEGIWSEEAPLCVQILCQPTQTSPENGLVNCDNGNILGSVCRFSCESDFDLDGVDEITCVDLDENDALGDWTDPPPTCRSAEVCLPIQIAPTNGDVSCDNDNNLGSVCTFTCTEGFALVGNSETTCTPTDTEPTWDNEPPTCEPIQCFPVQTDPDNGTVECTNGNNLGSDCTFACVFGFFLDGASLTTCLDDFNGDPEGIWSEPAPVCVQIICEPVQTDPDNGIVNCDDGNNLGSFCSFTCDPGYNLIGANEIDCIDLDENDAFGEWTDPPPTCRIQVCGSPPAAPENGNIDCDGITVGSLCEFSCDPQYTLEGPFTTTCVPSDSGPTWDNAAPICEPIICPEQRLPGGEVTCDTADRIATTNCSFRCVADGFELYPPGVTDNTCLDDTTWNVPRPCCTRPCPPFALMDFVIIMDSSSSIGRANWLIMKSFVRNIFESFALGPNAARFAVFRYNRVVDTRSQIIFSDYPGDMEAFLRAFDRIPYNGGGTLTGQALEHARDVTFTEENGDRPDVRDVMLIITDGRAQDNVTNVSIDLREHGVLTYALGIVPPSGSLDEDQLMDIAGSPDNLIIAEGGFEGLDDLFSQRLSTQICGNPCDDEPVDEN